MDLITYSLSKKIATSAVSGVASMEVDGTTLKITTNDGDVLEMVFPVLNPAPVILGTGSASNGVNYVLETPWNDTYNGLYIVVSGHANTYLTVGNYFINGTNFTVSITKNDITIKSNTGSTAGVAVYGIFKK